MEEKYLITVRIKRSDNEILEGLKDHPRQPLWEIFSEVVKIATQPKGGSK